MNILVTGCAGFIGSHLTDKLLSLGHNIVGVDSFLNNYNPEMKERNLQSALKSDRFQLIREDLLTSDIVNSLSDFDYIYHLAALPGVRTSWGESFKSYVDNNILVTQRILEYSKGSDRLKKFFFASSSSVYGQITKEKVSEDDPLRPFSPYGVTKLAAENLCELYRENFNVPTLSFRFFTVYGPRQRPDMAFSRLFQSVVSGKVFTIYGEGNQIRDYTYISDLVKCLVEIISYKDLSGVYNISGGTLYSLSEIIEKIENITGKKVNVKYISQQKGDVIKTGAEINKLYEKINFVPETLIDEGLIQQYYSTTK